MSDLHFIKERFYKKFQSIPKGNKDVDDLVILVKQFKRKSNKREILSLLADIEMHLTNSSLSAKDVNGFSRLAREIALLEISIIDYENILEKVTEKH